MGEHVEHGLIVSFTDESDSFVHGFEAGMIWQRLQSGEPEIFATIHTENAEVLRRMAAATGYALALEEVAAVAGWLNARLMSPGSFHSDPRRGLRVLTGGRA